MVLHINDLTKLIALQLGEYPEASTLGWTTPNGCSLRDMVEAEVELCAQVAVSELSLKDCHLLKDFSTLLHTDTDWGDGPPFRCPMPMDFMRLHSLKMPDWPLTLSESYPGDPQRLRLGDIAPYWLASRPSRPAAKILPATDGNPQILFFGPTGSSTPERAAYIPRPTYNAEEGMIKDFQPLAVFPLVRMIAEHIKTAYI